METLQQPKIVKARKRHQCNYCLGAIERYEDYEHSVHKHDDVYTWKSHIDCANIATELKMFDHADEGVTADMFHENICEEYRQIMIKTNLELYESKDFKYPTFHDQLKFVIEYHSKPKDGYNDLNRPLDNKHEPLTLL